MPNSPSVVDASDDYFRIRLVCTLLDVCGVYFDKGLLKKRMDNFLVFFQVRPQVVTLLSEALHADLTF